MTPTPPPPPPPEAPPVKNLEFKAGLLLMLMAVLLVGSAAYILFFRLIADVGPLKALTVTFLIPLFGVFWGWLLLGEQPTTLMLLAGALILGSVIASQRGSL